VSFQHILMHIPITLLALLTEIHLLHVLYHSINVRKNWQYSRNDQTATTALQNVAIKRVVQHLDCCRKPVFRRRRTASLTFIHHSGSNIKTHKYAKCREKLTDRSYITTCREQKRKEKNTQQNTTQTYEMY